MMPTMEERAEALRFGAILGDIVEERLRAKKLYPGETVADDSMTLQEKLGQLMEETGEVARALRAIRFPQQGRAMNLRDELIQVASVAISWLEAIDRNGTPTGMPQ